MILIDTSILVSYLRRPSPAIREVFASLDCGICGIIRAEILHGAKVPDDAARLMAALDSFVQLPTQESVWNMLGQNLARLRAAGQPMPVQDVLIATIGIQHNAEVWTHDKHFSTIQRIMPDLRLFIGPLV